VPHLYLIIDAEFPQKYEKWMSIDETFLEVCDIVCRLPGESKGADREVIRAKELGIPVMTFEELIAGK